MFILKAKSKRGQKIRKALIFLVIGLMLGGILMYTYADPIDATFIKPDTDWTWQAIDKTATPLFWVEIVVDSKSMAGYERVEMELFEYTDSPPPACVGLFCQEGEWAGHDQRVKVASAWVESSYNFAGDNGELYFSVDGGAKQLAHYGDLYNSLPEGEKYPLQNKVVRWYWDAPVKDDTYYMVRFSAKYYEERYPAEGPSVQPSRFFYTGELGGEETFPHYIPDITIVAPTVDSRYVNSTIPFELNLQDNIHGVGVEEVSGVSVLLTKVGRQYDYQLAEVAEGRWVLDLDSIALEDGIYSVSYEVHSSHYVGLIRAVGGTIAPDIEIDNILTPEDVAGDILFVVFLGFVGLIAVAVFLRFIYLPYRKARALKITAGWL